MGNMHMYEKEIKEHKKKYAEKCTKCNRGHMMHIAVYTYLCSFCGYGYKINPEDKNKPIEEFWGGIL